MAGWCPNEGGPEGGAVWGDAEELAMGVLDACVKPAADRLAGWHDVSRQLKAVGYCPHHHDERHYEARLVLARRLFIERCCAEGQAVTLFEDLAGVGGGGGGGV